MKEGLDASASLFTLTGETLAQACAIPVHLGTLIPVVATVLKSFPVDRMRPGDAYVMNDPYLGGTHLPDIAVIRPVFAGDRPVARPGRDGRAELTSPRRAPKLRALRMGG